MQAFSLAQKNIVVTGASSGIGRQCAITCSEAGARVILLGRNKERLEETLTLMTNPDSHVYYSIDLNEKEKVADLIQSAVNKYGKISGLVNAAGLSTTYPLRSITDERLDETFHINVYASIFLSKYICQPNIRQKEGTSIVFITSVMGMVGESGKSIYGMSKGALIAGAKSLAIENAKKNIRFNCISPGVVVTPMSKQSEYSKNEAALLQIKSYHPLGLGNPEDVAHGALYLLSDASKWVTGTNLVIDGGYTAR